MTEWKECKLGEVAEVKYGKDHKTLQEGKIPCYGSGGLMRNVSDQLYDKESILIPRKGTLNNILYENNPFWTVDTMFWTKINSEKTFPKYLFYQLTLIDYSGLNVGSAVPSLTVPVINAIDILLPPLPEQRAIACVLSSLDDKIDLLHRQNKTLEAMAETLFRQWFVEEADDTWEEGTIADLIEFNPNRKLSKGTLAPYLEMASLSTNSFMPTDWYTREFSSGMRFINGDTLIARITPCLENGKTAYITFLKETEIAWGSTEYIVMRPNKPIHTFFGYVLARTKDFRDYAEGCLEGTSGRQRVNIDHLMVYPIAIPDKNVIDNFNRFAESIVPKLVKNSIQIRTLESLRDTLLPKLMSGEVRVEI